MTAIAWIVLALIWSSTWLVVRVGLGELPPFTFAGVRFLLAAGVLFALRSGAIRRAAIGVEDRRLILRTGVVAFGITYALMFWGMQYITAGTAAVIFSTVPLFTMAFAHRDVAGENVTAAKLAGGLVGLAGVSLVVGQQVGADDRLAALGCAAVLGSAASMARAQVDIKASGSHLDPTVLAAWQLLVGGSLLLVAGAFVEGSPLALDWTPTALIVMIYLSVVCSSVAWFLYYWLLRRVKVTTMSTITLVQPVIAIALGWLLMGEAMRPQALIGAAGVLAGTSLIVRRRTGTTMRPETTVETGA
jgi:drug/metabolite transporter (DMT)-like permease